MSALLLEPILFQMPNEIEKSFGYWASINGVTFGEFSAKSTDVNIIIKINGSTNAKVTISMSRSTADKLQEKTGTQTEASLPNSDDLLAEIFVNILERVYSTARSGEFSICSVPQGKEKGRKILSGKSDPSSLSVRVDSGLGTIWVILSSMQN